MSINLVQHHDLGNFQHTITRAIAPESAQLLNNSALQMLQDLLYTQKTPSVYAKRDLLYSQKRPIVYAQETYQQCAPAFCRDAVG